ncbi:MAG: hypothetical protein ACRELA_19660 [Candidatus Rokuibacteriota bacterium]
MSVFALALVAGAALVHPVWNLLVILGEQHLPPRFIGAGIIVLGVLALGLAR